MSDKFLKWAGPAAKVVAAQRGAAKGAAAGGGVTGLASGAVLASMVPTTPDEATNWIAQFVLVKVGLDPLFAQVAALVLPSVLGGLVPAVLSSFAAYRAGYNTPEPVGNVANG